jgi:hypothetical protein
VGRFIDGTPILGPAKFSGDFGEMDLVTFHVDRPETVYLIEQVRDETFKAIVEEEPSIVGVPVYHNSKFEVWPKPSVGWAVELRKVRAAPV